MDKEVQNVERHINVDEEEMSSSTLTFKYRSSTSFLENSLEEKNAQLAFSSLNLQSLKECALNPNRPVFLDRFNVMTNGASLDVHDQGETGLCWIHSGLMYLESCFHLHKIDKRLSLSPHYLAFYDKLEKSIVFLSKAKKEKDSRTLYHLLNDNGPILTDGGTWGMFLHLINKYGLATRDEVILTHQATHTSQMNQAWRNILRNLAAEEKTSRQEAIKKVFDFLTRCLGFIPRLREKLIEIPFNNKEENDETKKNETPVYKSMERLKFANLFDFNKKTHVCLTHGVDREEGWYASYSTNDVNDDEQHKFYVVHDIELLATAAYKSLKKGECVPFTADIRYMRDKKSSILDPETFDYDTLLGTNVLHNDKKRNMNQGCIVPNHAMLLVAVERENNKFKQWKILNSWGKRGKHAGYLIMSHKWFQMFVFEITVRKTHIHNLPPSSNVKKCTPWDIFSTVAGS